MEAAQATNAPHPSSVNAVPRFYAKDNAQHWLATLDRFSRMYSWTDESKLDVAVCRLGEDAAAWYAGVEQTAGDWLSFRTAFLERYEVDKEELYGRLARCRQSREESVKEYADRYRSLAAQLGVDTQVDPIHMYNFLQGLKPSVYDKVFLMRPQGLDQAIKDAIYVSEGLTRQLHKDPGPSAGGNVPQPRHPSNEVTESSRPTFRPGPMPPHQSFNRGPGPRPSEQRGQGERIPEPPRRVDPRQRPSAEPATGVEDLTKQMARLSLLLERGPQVQYYTPAEYCDLDSKGGDTDPREAYVRDPELFTKQVADFDPIPLPRKRVPAAPGQDAPWGTPPTPALVPGRSPRDGPANPATANPSRDPTPPNPTPGPAPVALPARFPYRPRRATAEATGRTDPIPEDPQAEERRIAEEIVNKINKYSVPLGVALKCDATSIYTKIGNKVLSIARQRGRDTIQPGTRQAPGVGGVEAHQWETATGRDTACNAASGPSAQWQVCKARVLLAEYQAFLLLQKEFSAGERSCLGS